MELAIVLTTSYSVGSDEAELRDLTLGDLLAWAAETTPDRLALVAGVAEPGARRTWTYAELHAASLRTAHALLRRFEPGERVAVWAPNIPEWLTMEFGAAMAGLVLVTINPGRRGRVLFHQPPLAPPSQRGKPPEPEIPRQRG